MKERILKTLHRADFEPYFSCHTHLHHNAELFLENAVVGGLVRHVYHRLGPVGIVAVEVIAGEKLATARFVKRGHGALREE